MCVIVICVNKAFYCVVYGAVCYMCQASLRGSVSHTGLRSNLYIALLIKWFAVNAVKINSNLADVRNSFL